MKQDEIKALNGAIITPEELEKIELSNCVKVVDFLGVSNLYTGCYQFQIDFENKSSIDVYVNIKTLDKKMLTN